MDSSRLLRDLREFFFVPSVLNSLSSMTERERLNKITESPEPLIPELVRGLQHGEHGGAEVDSSRSLRVLREFFFVPSALNSLSSMTERERLNKITEAIIGAAIQVHRVLGPGLLESAYVACLAYELGKRGLVVEQQKGVPLVYEEVKLEFGYRMDLLVEQSVVVEVKSIDALAPIHEAQTLSYLRLSGCKLALLINFNVTVLKDGIRRFINGTI